MSDFREILDNVDAYGGGSDGFVDLNIPESGDASVKYPTDRYLDLDQETGEITYPDDGFVDTPSPQPESPYSFPHIRGAASVVEESLARVTFMPGSAGEMSASIAYIRYWSRNGAQQKVAVGQEDQDSAPTDPQKTLDEALKNINAQPFTTSTLPPPADRSPQPLPTNSAYLSRPRQPVTPSGTTRPGPSLPLLGQIFGANPGAVSKLFPASDAPSPDGAVWQFLFNPEELQLSSGPDFNRAETWGVADPANSGQPLSWRANKNRKLAFSKVLLHGYTFGRRVDSLESGLQQLFMARDGENGSDGPPVLEFVWGQRVFGPCVIQNIQVREKAWDRGLLVNAEVSFDLEQVPEWTINDGFVDVLRPGRQSTINDPSLPGQTSQESETTPAPEQEPPPANKPGGGGGQPSQDNSRSYASCQKAFYFAEVFSKLQIEASNIKAFLGDTEDRNKRLTDNYTIKLKRAYDQSVSSVGTPFTKRIPSNQTIEAVLSAVSEKQKTQDSPLQKYSRIMDLLVSACFRYKAAMENVWNKDCKDLIKRGKRAQEDEKNKNNKEFLCKSIVHGGKCTIGAGESRVNPCTSKALLCQANGFYKELSR